MCVVFVVEPTGHLSMSPWDMLQRVRFSHAHPQPTHTHTQDYQNPSLQCWHKPGVSDQQDTQIQVLYLCVNGLRIYMHLQYE